MNMMPNSSKKLDRWEHRIMPIPRKRLDKEVYTSGQWIPTWSMNYEWERNKARHYAKKSKVTTSAVEVSLATSAVEVSLVINGTSGTVKDGDGILTQETTSL
ncbi:hypothetical protein KIW84_056796 [Lathyrus oleraceus]|uniref:Uncharacterized protein n=1 Tax=Pisum sativum TaxID=3888 RepID=A0A9D5AHB6_PEA|nr:hypothetical protein KIW84_056796 [Pisum sativum]